MHLNDVGVALKVFEIGEKVLPEFEDVLAEMQKDADGHRPTLKQAWPHIKAALDATINETPVGDIRV